MGCETNLLRQVLEGSEFFSKFLEIIGKICWSARRIILDRFLYGDYFFGNFWKLLENIVGVRDVKTLHTGSLRVICFRKFLENIVGVRDEYLHTGSLRVIFLSEIFGNYWKALLECETNIFTQVL